MIPLFKSFMTEAAAEAAKQTLLSGYLTQGPVVEKLEQELITYLNYPYIATVNTATAGLHLALRLAGVKPGSQVISCPLTCFASNTPILAQYASIKWADVDPNTCNIDIDDVVQKVDEDIDAILVIHWGGVPVDIVSLEKKVASKLGYCPPIIEDCAHAFGATYKDYGSPVGTLGNFCSFSFQAIKHLVGAGDGGLLTVPQEQYERAKLLRWYGIDRDSTKNKSKDFRSDIPVKEWGYKYHMNDVVASVLLENLKVVDKQVLSIHRSNAAFYRQELRNVNGLELFEEPFGSNPSYWLFTIKVARRDDFMEMMKAKGVIVSKVHERNDNHPCIAQFKISLPKLDSFADNYICIPVGWWVRPENREYIVQCIKEGW